MGVIGTYQSSYTGLEVEGALKRVIATPGSGAIDGKVTSVNGKAGNVNLTAKDVGALSATTTPTVGVLAFTDSRVHVGLGSRCVLDALGTVTIVGMPSIVGSIPAKSWVMFGQLPAGFAPKDDMYIGTTHENNGVYAPAGLYIAKNGVLGMRITAGAQNGYLNINISYNVR